MHRNRRGGKTIDALNDVVCVRCRQHMDVGARFCASCGAEAEVDSSHERGIPDAQRRQITLLFCDMVDSTGLAEQLDPEELADVVGLFHRAVRIAVREFGGFVARHAGDGNLTYFGYPEAHEDDAERAVKAALRVLEAVAALPVGESAIHAHIGIATGLVVVGDIAGTGLPQGLDVAGSAPNLAARLQSLAPHDCILVSDTTRRLVGDLIEWRDLGELSLKGLAKPVRAWQAIGPRPTQSRFEAQHSGALAPLLGRDSEVARIEAAWNDACHTRGQVVVIRGDPGIGKSRLAIQVLDILRSQPHTRVRYFSSSHRNESPLHPCVQQLEHAAAFARDDTLAEKLVKLKESLPPIPERDLQLIAEMLLIPTAGSFPVLQLAPLRRRELLMSALLNVLDVLSRRQPVLVVYEDAHWSDDSSLELLSRLVAQCQAQQILLLVTAWPDVALPWARLPHVTELSLSPLDPAQRMELAGWVAAGRALPGQIVDDIVKRSDGIPLYVEELTQAFVEGADDKSSPGGTVPASLQASLQARLDRLGEATRSVAQAASCIGRDFHGKLLALVTGRSGSQLEADLKQLAAASLIVPRTVPDQDGMAYAFRHALLRDEAYETLVGVRRRGTHARIATVLEEHFPQLVAAQPDLMAHHCAEGALPAKAVDYWFNAGVQAMRRSSMSEALVFLRRGLKAIGDLPPGSATEKKELDFTIALGQAQIATQGYATSETRQTFTSAKRLCEGLGRPPQLLSVLHGLWTHSLMTADMTAARNQALELLRQGAESRDPLWLLMGHRFSGVTHHPVGEFSEAVTLLRRGIALYDPALRPTYAPITPDDPEVVMLTYLSWSLMCMGHLDAARAASMQALEKARALGQAYSLAHALIGTAFVSLTIESPQAGLARLDEALPLMKEHGIAYYDAVGMLFKAWCLAALHEGREARQLLEQGMKAYRATGSSLYLSGFLRMSAEASIRIGEPAEAERCIEESFRIMRDTGQHWDEAEIHRIRGELLLARGSKAEAIAEFGHGIDVAARQGAGLWRLRSACALADLLAEQGDRAAARDHLEPVCHDFASQSDLPDVTRARSILAALS
jgi:class 3 adenylate cyclase/predicted ATPase